MNIEAAERSDDPINILMNCTGFAATTLFLKALDKKILDERAGNRQKIGHIIGVGRHGKHEDLASRVLNATESCTKDANAFSRYRNIIQQPAAVSFLEADIRKPQWGIEPVGLKHIRNKKTSHIAVLTGGTSFSDDEKTKQKMHEDHVLGTQKALGLASDCAIGTVDYFSTLYVLGLCKNSDRLREEILDPSSITPSNPYTAAKLEGEQKLFKDSQKSKKRVIRLPILGGFSEEAELSGLMPGFVTDLKVFYGILKSAHIYQNRLWRKRFVKYLAGHLARFNKESLKITFPGEEETLMNMLHADKAMDAALELILAQVDESNLVKVSNIAPKEPLTLGDLMALTKVIKDSNGDRLFPLADNIRIGQDPGKFERILKIILGDSIDKFLESIDIYRPFLLSQPKADIDTLIRHGIEPAMTIPDLEKLIQFTAARRFKPIKI